MKQYFKSINFCVGFFFVSTMLAFFVASFVYVPYDPFAMDSTCVLQAPSLAHWFGTDNFGRDIFSRMLIGSKATFYVGVLAVCIGMVVGVICGACAGYFGGVVDVCIMRVIDAMMAFPGVILALVFITVFGSTTANIAIALGIMATPRFCRMTRSGFMQVKQMEYIEASKCRGASTLRIMVVHILPNIASSLLVTVSLSFSSAVLSEAGLSYLGLGIQPPNPSWGKMLYESQAYLLNNPWYAIVSGAMITMLVLGFNLLGDGIQDVNEGRII